MNIAKKHIIILAATALLVLGVGVGMIIGLTALNSNAAQEEFKGFTTPPVAEEAVSATPGETKAVEEAAKKAAEAEAEKKAKEEAEAKAAAEKAAAEQSSQQEQSSASGNAQASGSSDSGSSAQSQTAPAAKSESKSSSSGNSSAKKSSSSGKSSQPSQSSSIISEGAARNIVLGRIPGATIVYLTLDWDDGIQQYEGEAVKGNKEYEFEINASSGVITEWDEDYIDDDDD